MCGIRAEMDVATWNFCSAVGHALDVVVTDTKKKHRRGNSLNTSTHLDHWCVWEFTPGDLRQQNSVGLCLSLQTNKQTCAKLAKPETKISLVWLT